MLSNECIVCFHTRVGDSIDADFCGEGTFYKGTIVRCMSYCTYAIVYDDGDVEVGVPELNIRPRKSP